MKVIVAGGSGFIGKTLVERLMEQGHSVVVLTRSPGKLAGQSRNLSAERWDGKTAGDWTRNLEGADAIVNLTGEPIAGKRWTRRQKDLILTSRIDSTRALVLAIERARRKPSVLINVSGVDIYDDRLYRAVTEEAPIGTGFLARVCAEWEASALEAEQFGVRVVIPRMGVVLSRDGGALTRLMTPFRFFVGGYVGSGQQWFPWVHIEDVTSVFIFLLKNTDVRGPVNLAAPEHVTMKEFTKIMGRVLHRPSWTAVPAFILRLALGEMAEMLLTGQRVVPQKLLNAGFTFTYQTTNKALADMLKREAL